MPRLHLFELEDQEWFPRVLRDAMTDCLGFMSESRGIWDATVPRLAALLRHEGSMQILDLCSGAGGPILRVAHKLRDEHGLPVQVRLTDLSPNVEAWARAESLYPGVRGFPEPVDATKVSPELPGVRTFYTSFHHFPPARARGILADAQATGQTLAIFEATSRSFASLLATVLSPLVMLAAIPFVPQLRWSRLVWTYLVPVLPLCCLWDGIVSCLRSYSAAELRELVRGLDGEGYRWEIVEERLPGTPIRVAHLLGSPGARRP